MQEYTSHYLFVKLQKTNGIIDKEQFAFYRERKYTKVKNGAGIPALRKGAIAMTLDQLNYLLVLAEEQNVTRAAQRLDHMRVRDPLIIPRSDRTPFGSRLLHVF